MRKSDSNYPVILGSRATPGLAKGQKHKDSIVHRAAALLGLDPANDTVFNILPFLDVQDLYMALKHLKCLLGFFTTKGRRVNLRGDFVISASGGYLLEILYVLMLPWCCVHLVVSCVACCSYNNHLFQ